MSAIGYGIIAVTGRVHCQRQVYYYPLHQVPSVTKGYMVKGNLKKKKILTNFNGNKNLPINLDFESPVDYNYIEIEIIHN